MPPNPQRAAEAATRRAARRLDATNDRIQKLILKRDHHHAITTHLDYQLARLMQHRKPLSLAYFQCWLRSRKAHQ